MNNDLIFPISIAPMMDYTDRHFRMLMRFITKKTLLYTEMISTGAILHGNKKWHLGFSQEEKPLILQLGGDNPSELAECTRIAAEYNYDEVNLNCGCPSDKVQRGNFGAALMADPKYAGMLVRSMVDTKTLPVSVKCRIGIDGSKLNLPTLTDYAALKNFVEEVFSQGASRLTVHARIAILGGLSPKENREVPPLQYPLVYKLKEDFPKSHIELNGGVNTLAEIETQLTKLSGVMIGRAAVDNPLLFSSIDSKYASKNNSIQSNYINTEIEELKNTPNNYQEDTVRILYKYAKYLEAAKEQNIQTHRALRHIIPFFNGLRGARKWRYALSKVLHKDENPTKNLDHALEYSGLIY